MSPARLEAALRELGAGDVVAPRPSFVEELEHRLRLLAPLDAVDLTADEPAATRPHRQLVSAAAALLVVVLAAGALVVPRDERVRTAAPASAVTLPTEEGAPAEADAPAPAAVQPAVATELAAPAAPPATPSAAQPTAVPPAATPPVQLRLHCQRGPAGITLQWDRFSGSAFDAYLVVRHDDAEDRDGPYGGTVVARLYDVEQTRWHDTATAAGAPAYRVFALDAAGRVIGESNEASPGTALGVPLGLPQLELAIS